MNIKNFALIIAAFSLLFFMAGCKKWMNTGAGKSSGDLKEKISYVIGHDIGDNMKKNNIEVNPDVLLKGLRDGLSGTKSRYSEEEVQKIMGEFQAEMQKKNQEIAEKNKKEGTEFLEKNKKIKGVITLPSGLQYKVIKEGTGPVPKPTDYVKANYSGKLIDGTEFDSSYSRNEPAVFPVTGVIKGWQEALQLMKTGSKWEFYVPSELANGEVGRRGSIAPNSVLIFDLELISIEKRPK